MVLSSTLMILSSYYLHADQPIHAKQSGLILPLSLQQILNFGYEHEDKKNILTSYYSLKINRQTYFIAWVRDTQNKEKWSHVWGGGVESPFITVGSYYEHGTYKLFDDISDSKSWDSATFQHTRWSIRRSPVQVASMGVMLTFPQFLGHRISTQSRPLRNPIISLGVAKIPTSSSSTSSSNSSEEHEFYQPWKFDGYYHIGATAGYKFSFWEPRVLYRYYFRESLPLSSGNWSSWILTEPTALSMHQMIMVQKFRIGNFFWGNLVAKSIISDTMQEQWLGKITLRAILPIIEVGVHLALSEDHAIDNEWKFSKYLWNTSSEILLYYANLIYGDKNQSHAYVRVRTEVAEYNKVRERLDFPQSIRRVYQIKWKHPITLVLKHKKELEWYPELEYGYTYSNNDEYHVSIFKLGMAYLQWSPFLRNRVYWYIDEKSRNLEKLNMSQSFYLKYTFLAIPINVWTRFTWNIEKDTEETFDSLGDELFITTKDIISSIGMSLRKKYLLSTFSMTYLLVNDNNDEQRKFQSEFSMKIDLRFKW